MFYAHLIRTGWTQNMSLREVYGYGSAVLDAQWDAWYESIEVLASSDGLVVLRTDCLDGDANGFVPAVEIGRPDGGDYGFARARATDKMWRETILPAIERDWGDLLEQLRARYPLPG